MDFDPKKYDPQIMYLSMGAFLESNLPTYSGGLEVLAGDILQSCADLKVPIAGFIQASNSGYFRQVIDENGWQIEQPVYWAPEKTLPRIKNQRGKTKTITIKHRGRDLKVGAEVYVLNGQTGFKVPVFLIDSNFEENNKDDRLITSHLYVANRYTRIPQENILGQGSVKLARALGYNSVKTFHLNEGHACFATLELLAENGYSDEEVRKLCVFNTHTPVGAGHDVFEYDDVGAIVGDFLPIHIRKLAGEYQFNTTKLATNLSRSVIAVSRKHAEVCREMDVFKGIDINYVTNGVHVRNWASEPMSNLFDEYIEGWKKDPRMLDKALKIPIEEFSYAKDLAKRKLIGYINTHTDARFDQDVMTIVWARRFTDYKRPDLIFKDVDRLMNISEKYGHIQIVFAGKSHPNDTQGKERIQEIIKKSKEIDHKVRITFLPRYNATMAKRLIGGADIWLNTPLRPQEASGTSGMKVLCNGGLNMSTYDGWFIEGIEMDPNIGWVIGPRQEQTKTNPDRRKDDWDDAQGLYDSLEDVIKVYYDNEKEWANRGLHAVTLAAHFNTHRVVKEYAEKAWNIKI